MKITLDRLTNDLVLISYEYAKKCHNSTNHLYDGKPYDEAHLQLVVDTAVNFIQVYPELIPTDMIPNIISACWCHDIIEDTRQTPNDVVKNTNLEVAKLVFALTNEKGWNRDDRSNDKYYEGIRNTPYAIFVKLCDRIANVNYSKSHGSSMFKKYQKENNHFISKIYDDKYEVMFNYLKSLMG